MRIFNNYKRSLFEVACLFKQIVKNIVFYLDKFEIYGIISMVSRG